MSNVAGQSHASPPQLLVGLAWLTSHWLSLTVATIVTSLLLIKWVVLGSSRYEAQAVIRYPKGAEMHSLVVLVAQRRERTRPQNATIDVRVAALSPQTAVFTCQADTAHGAYRQCGDLVADALVSNLAESVVRPTTLPARPQPLGAWYELLLGALVAGGVAGLLTGVVRRWAELHGATAPAGVPAGPPVGARLSSVPPGPRFYTVSPNAAGHSRAEERSQGVRLAALPAPSGIDETSADDAPMLGASRQTYRDLSTLRDQLYVRAATGSIVVGVTADEPGRQAKSRIAVELALLLAEATHIRVLLVEADFQRPQVDSVTGAGVPPFGGFSKQIYNRMREGRREPWAVVSHRDLSVLAEGVVRTPSMMYSEHFPEAIAELRDNYDILVADGPVLSATADIRAFDEITDGVLFVGSPGSTHAVSRVQNLFQHKAFVLTLAS